MARDWRRRLQDLSLTLKRIEYVRLDFVIVEMHSLAGLSPTLTFNVGMGPIIGLHPSTLDIPISPTPSFQFDSLYSFPPLSTTMSQNPVSSSTNFPEDRYILVTGSTGFIGAHVVDNLLARGYRVRGATRSAQKGEQMKAARPHYASKLDFVVIEDFTKTGVFDSAMDGIDGVIHVASVREPIIINIQNAAR